MSNDINFNAIMEALNDKADRDGNNVTGSHLKNINILGGGQTLKGFLPILKADYDALQTKDSEILYLTYEA